MAKADEALDLDAIDARSNAATPPPWAHVGRENVTIGAGYLIRSAAVDPGTDHRAPGPYAVDMSASSIADAEFIVHARADVPALCAEVRRLRRIVAREKGGETERKVRRAQAN